MDTFENMDIFPEEPEEKQEESAPAYEQPVQEPKQEPQNAQDSVYHGAGAGRKESPYANSPYERMHQSEEPYRYQPQPKAPKVKKQKKARKPGFQKILAAVLALAVVAGSCLVTAQCVNQYWEERNEETVDMLMGQIEDLRSQIKNRPANTIVAGSLAPGEGLTPSQLYSTCVDSVVAISTTIQSTGYYGGSGGSTGSGFVLSEDGYVLTNYHVVEDADEITVITHDGEEYPAELVGYDSSANDLAVLKVEATGLKAAAIGSSDDLMIGDMVAAIGNPLGELSATQTIGYVSGIGREVATGSLTTISMIQTDAAINPGNSGGPLFNMRGEVIGITTAKYSGTTNSGASIEGIGFAIPIDDIMSVLDDLIEYGYVTGAYMGVSVQNTDESSAAMFGLPTGAYIVSVEKGGAADRAGIKAKDIVIKLDSYDIGNVTDLTRALRNYKAGDTATVTVIRGGAQMELEITLDEKPQSDPAAPTNPSEPTPPSGDYDEWYEYFRRYFGE